VGEEVEAGGEKRKRGGKGRGKGEEGWEGGEEEGGSGKAGWRTGRGRTAFGKRSYTFKVREMRPGVRDKAKGDLLDCGTVLKKVTWSGKTSVFGQKGVDSFRGRMKKKRRRETGAYSVGTHEKKKRPLNGGNSWPEERREITETMKAIFQQLGGIQHNRIYCRLGQETPKGVGFWLR